MGPESSPWDPVFMTLLPPPANRLRHWHHRLHGQAATAAKAQASSAELGMASAAKAPTPATPVLSLVGVPSECVWRFLASSKAIRSHIRYRNTYMPTE